MPNKSKGILIASIGFIIAAISWFSDLFRHRPIEFGPVQISIGLFGFFVIFFGCYTAQKKDILEIKKIIEEFQKNPRKAITNTLLIITIIFLSIHPIKYIISWITFPYPIEYREVASILPAVSFSNGINPYALNNFPENMYVYGPMYPILLSVFLSFGKNPFLIARCLNLLFLLLFLLLSYWYLRNRKASIISSLIGILILLNSMCFIWQINGARPDTPAIFFGFLAFIFLFKRQKIGLLDLILCSLLCIISYHFKQYMVFSSFIIATYLFLYVSKKSGVIFILSCIILGAASFLLFYKSLPMYYNYSVIHHLPVHDINYTEHMVQQAKDFFDYYWVLCLFYPLSIHRKIIKSKIVEFNKSDFIKGFNEPLLRKYHIDFFDIGVFLSLFILTIWIGRRGGNEYTYYGELLLPYLVYATIPEIEGFFNSFSHRIGIQFVFLFFCIFPLRATYQPNYEYSKAGFERLITIESQCKDIYDKTPLASFYKVIHNIKPVYNSGQSEYAVTTMPKYAGILGSLSRYNDDEISLRISNWNEIISNSVDNKQFDCIFSDNSTQIDGYQFDTEIPNILGRTVYLFIPEYDK